MAERHILHLTPIQAAELGHELIRLSQAVGTHVLPDAYAYTKTFESERPDNPTEPERFRIRIGR